MPGGRPRKPLAVHKAEGTLRTRRKGMTNDPTSGAPRKPRGLKGDALNMWQSIVPQLVEAGYAKAIDSAALGEMCRWWAEYREASKMPRDDYKRLHQMAVAFKQFMTLASRFGLTPADRANLRAEAVGKDDPFAAFLRKRMGQG